MHPSEIGLRRPIPKAAPPKRQVGHLPTNDIFRVVNDAARGRIRDLAERWLPTTRLRGNELWPLNPTRADKNIGSFAINTHTGLWGDFATGDRGGDIISFYAYLHGVSQIEAARALANILGARA